MAFRKSDKKEIDKLMEIIESTPEKVVFEDTDVEKFILDNDLVLGQEFVPNSVVYYNYYQWSKKPITRNKFFNIMDEYFEKKRTPDELGYLINKDSFDTTQSGWLKARAFYRKRRDAKRQKKEKKRSD